jgi:ABC-2 type transport system permease protein
MVLSSLYLVYGREAEAFNEALQEPVQLLSGIYFPVYSPVMPLAIQVVASVIPLTIGMDALRRTIFSNTTTDPNFVMMEILVLFIMAIILLFTSQRSLRALEERGRKSGTIAVRQR